MLQASKQLFENAIHPLAQVVGKRVGHGTELWTVSTRVLRRVQLFWLEMLKGGLTTNGKAKWEDAVSRQLRAVRLELQRREAAEAEAEAAAGDEVGASIEGAAFAGVEAVDSPHPGDGGSELSVSDATWRRLVRTEGTPLRAASSAPQPKANASYFSGWFGGEGNGEGGGATMKKEL
jgi:hypothetical protein